MLKIFFNKLTSVVIMGGNKGTGWWNWCHFPRPLSVNCVEDGKMEDLLEKCFTAMMRTNVWGRHLHGTTTMWSLKYEGSLENISGRHMHKQSVLELSTLKEVLTLSGSHTRCCQQISSNWLMVLVMVLISMIHWNYTFFTSYYYQCD